MPGNTPQEELKEKLKDPSADTMINVHIDGQDSQIRRGDLVRKVCVFENEQELTHAIEYRINENDEEPCHRSVHVQLKR